MSDHPYCPHGCDRGHCIPCLRQRVAELEAALAQRAEPLRWTRDVPTQEGYYWWRDRPSGVRLVEFYGSNVAILGSHTSGPLKLFLSGELAGPISPPADEVPREPVGPAVFGCYPEGRR